LLAAERRAAAAAEAGQRGLLRHRLRDDRLRGEMSKFEYAPAPESRAVVDIDSSYGLFIDGEFVEGSGAAMKTVNPATEEVLADVAVADEADVDRAVAAARRAQEQVWGPLPGAERAKY